jgi:hypothetical protein
MSKLGYEANDIFTVARAEARQHISANFDLARAYFRHEPMPGCGKLDVHDSAVPRSAQSNHQTALFKSVERRGDRRDRRSQRLSDPAHIPFFRPADYYKQADVVRMKVSIGTSSDDAGLQLEPLEQRRHTLVQGERLTVTN